MLSRGATAGWVAAGILVLVCVLAAVLVANRSRLVLLLRRRSFELPADTCYVISLDNDEGRRRLRRLRGTALGPHLHVVPGVDGKRADLRALEASGTLRRMYLDAKGQRRMLSPSEAGCLMSHVEVWRRLASDSSADTALVLEDDAYHFDPEFDSKVASALRDAPPDWGVFLCGFWIHHSFPAGKEVSRAIVRVDRFLLLHCYIIRKWAAKVLLEQKPYTGPSDTFMSDHSGRVPIYRHRHEKRALWDADPTRSRFGTVSTLSTQRFDRSQIHHTS